MNFFKKKPYPGPCVPDRPHALAAGYVQTEAAVG